MVTPTHLRHCLSNSESIICFAFSDLTYSDPTYSNSTYSDPTYSDHTYSDPISQPYLGELLSTEPGLLDPIIMYSWEHLTEFTEQHLTHDVIGGVNGLM
jgi:hypothetical protein